MKVLIQDGVEPQAPLLGRIKEGICLHISKSRTLSDMASGTRLQLGSFWSRLIKPAVKIILIAGSGFEKSYRVPGA